MQQHKNKISFHVECNLKFIIAQTMTD